MKIKLIESSPVPQKTNRLDEFEVGSIGIVRRWDGSDQYNGVIVKRESCDILRRLENVITGHHIHFTTKFEKQMNETNRHYYIETLTPGTILEITL